MSKSKQEQIEELQKQLEALKSDNAVIKKEKVKEQNNIDEERVNDNNEIIEKKKVASAETINETSELKRNKSGNGLKIAGFLISVVLILGSIIVLGIGIYRLINKDKDDQEITDRHEEIHDELKQQDDKELSESLIKNLNGEERDEGEMGGDLDGPIIEDEVIDEDSEGTPEGEFLDNDDYLFRFVVEDPSRYKYEEMWSEVAGMEYPILLYCYQLDDTKYDGGWDCGEGYFASFSISIMSSEQWAEYKDGPYGDLSIVVGEEGGLYYIFERTNSDVPDELKGDIEWLFEVVQESFTVNESLTEI